MTNEPFDPRTYHLGLPIFEIAPTSMWYRTPLLKRIHAEPAVSTSIPGQRYWKSA